MSIAVGEGEVYLVIRTTAYRRTVSFVAMLGAGALAIYLGISESTTGFIWSAILVLIGIGLLMLAQRFLKATSVGLELTDTEVRDTSGRVLCRLDQIEKVDRGVMALKPSNGLALVLNQSLPRAWEPGLWWCTGRKIGIGGSTAPSQAKALADTILLIKSDGKGPFGTSFKPDPDDKPT